MSDRYRPQTGPRYEYRTLTGSRLEFWAEDGMLLVEDQDTGEVVTLNREEARDHFRAIREAYDRAYTLSTDDLKLRQHRDAYRRLLLDMDQALRDVRAQADPATETVVQRKERAEIRTQLAAYGTVHDGATPRPYLQEVDGRAAVDPRTGTLQLKRGAGHKRVRKYY